MNGMPRAGPIAGLAVLYVLTAWAGLQFALVHASATAIWPPAGIALAAILLLGTRAWPAIFLGAFVVNVTTAGSVATSLGIALGNTLEALAGAALVHRFAGGVHAFERVRTILAFAVVAGMVSTTIGATAGVTSLALGGHAPWSGYGRIWITWWLGDAAGDILFAPLVLLWSVGRFAPWSWRRAMEGALLLAAVAASGLIAFAIPVVSGGPYSLDFLCLPPLLWAAYRFGPRGVTTVIALLAGIAIWGTFNGLGPFHRASPNESLLLLQVFLTTLATTMLPVAALVWERKRMEVDRQRAQETFRLAVEAAPNAMIMVDERGAVVLVNAHAEQLFGYDRDAILGRSIELLVPARSRDVHPGLRGEFFAAPQSRAMGTGRDLFALRKDGSEIPVEIGLNPIRTEAGLFVLAAVVDITERKRVEQERERWLAQEQAARRKAEAAERRLAFLGEIAGSISASLDFDTVLQRIVEGARELCGSDLAAILLRDGDSPSMRPRFRAGGSWSESYEALRVEPGRGVGGRVLITRRPFRTDDYLDDPRVSGDYRRIAEESGIVALMVVPILIGERVEGLLYVDNCSPRPFTDEDETMCMRLAGHAAIAIRNAELFRREQDARAEAETANRAKDQFLAVVSHELRTPLNAMTGWVRLLRSNRFDERQRLHGLDVIERNARLQAQLINDLLDVSRFPAGKLELDRVPMDLAPVVEDAVDALRADAEAKGLSIAFDLDPAGAVVLGDARRLHQVVANLLSNAVKFTPRGGRVEVRLRRHEDEVRLSVSDTGEGLDPATLQHIFEPFYQADTTTTRMHRGLGLGLAIVHQLVELHGGHIRAESGGRGRGTTFLVTVPAAALVGRHPAADVEPPRPARSLHAPLAGVTVLVVDDDPDGRELTAFVLRQRGATVAPAGTAAEALDVVRKGNVDVLVSDIAMPGVDGHELITLVRRVQDRRSAPPIPAIALTAYAERAARRFDEAEGFDAVASKPVDPDALVDLVLRLARG
jgi:PAS domain S-box-containing protein